MRHFLNKEMRALQFRSNSAGDILLRADWAALVASLGAIPEWIIQSLHPYGRLVGRMPIPAWEFAEASPSSRDPEGRLHLLCSHWHHAVARFEKCPCCDSPGYIEIRNAAAQPILQFRAPSGTPVGPLAALAAKHAAPAGLAPAASFASPELVLPRFDATGCNTAPASALPAFLSRLGTAGVALLWRLGNGGCDHRRLFAPSSVGLEDSVLTASGPYHNTCQLILPAAQHLALETSPIAERVHVLAPDGALLLTLAPALGRHQPVWATEVLSLFTANR